MKMSLLSIALLAALGGCSLIPDYQRPEAPTAASWPAGEAYIGAPDAGNEMELDWQVFFRDPDLRQLINVALENNRDLRVAALNVDAQRVPDVRLPMCSTTLGGVLFYTTS